MTVIDIVKQLGCVRHNGVVMTAEERAAGYDHAAAKRTVAMSTRGSLAASIESLRAEMATYGVEPREGRSRRLQIHQARETARANGIKPLASRTVTTAKAKVNHQSAEIERAAIIQSANEAEKKRWATVLAHEASQGREKMAIHLLGHAYGFSASQIIAGLQGTANGPSQAATTTWGKAESWDVIRADVLERTGRA